jgi:hypothetical protein
MSPKREMRCPGNMFRTMVIGSFTVCAVAPSCWNRTLVQFILLVEMPPEGQLGDRDRLATFNKRVVHKHAVLNRSSLHCYWSGQPRGKECWPPRRRRPPLGLPTEYYTFKRCQVPVGHPVYITRVSVLKSDYHIHISADVSQEGSGRDTWAPQAG